MVWMGSQTAAADCSVWHDQHLLALANLQAKANLLVFRKTGHFELATTDMKKTHARSEVKI